MRKNLLQEQVMCDIELYFFLNAEKKAWEITVTDGYCGMNCITQEIFGELLQDYCLLVDIEIVERKYTNETIAYQIKEFDRSKLLQKTIR